MANSVTLSSVGTSNGIAIDYVGSNGITALVTLGSTTMTVDFTVQYTLDDLGFSSSPVWLGLGSSIGSSIIHYSSANADAGVAMGIAYPLGGLRLSSTAISSSSLTLKVLQGPTV